MKEQIKEILIKLTDTTGFNHSSISVEAFAQAEDEILFLLSIQEEKIRKEEREKLIQEIDVLSAHLYNENWTLLRQNIIQ